MNKVEQWQLAVRRKLPLEQKIAMSLNRIRAWDQFWDLVSVSFSGGLDSTALLHLVRSILPDTQAVFVDTGLEYPENKQLVKSTENVLIIKPKKKFRQVIEQYGYPVVSKRYSQYIREVRNSKGYTATKRLRLTGYNSKGEFSAKSMIPKKWQYLIQSPFKINDRCCFWLKKQPLRKIEKMGYMPFVGTRAAESNQRAQSYYRYGCNAFDMKHPRSTPLAFWTDQDILDYIRIFNVPYSKLYDMGYKRSGCMFCMFGLPFEDSPNRFQRMKLTHPKHWKFCIEKLGLGPVIEYIGCQWNIVQPTLPGFEKMIFGLPE
ncbi:MAG: class V aminotransferase [Planctomycetota bacterium]|nr:MAG: class V aminotransferase [Planctomycetota bacterium]